MIVLTNFTVFQEAQRDPAVPPVAQRDTANKCKQDRKLEKSTVKYNRD